MRYVLKTNSTEGVYYYMNIMCVTQQPRNAMHYDSAEDAQKDMEHFKNMFHYEEVQPIIEEYKGGYNENN